VSSGVGLAPLLHSRADEMVTPQEKDLWRDSVTLSFGGIRGPFTSS
jgi:hypothetical protein